LLEKEPAPAFISPLVFDRCPRMRDTFQVPIEIAIRRATLDLAATVSL
jgi:hypothetical protein